MIEEPYLDFHTAVTTPSQSPLGSSGVGSSASPQSIASAATSACSTSSAPAVCASSACTNVSPMHPLVDKYIYWVNFLVQATDAAEEADDLAADITVGSSLIFCN